MIFDIGFVIPLESEAAPLMRLLKNSKKIIVRTRTIIKGQLNNKNICIIISGCGKIKAASATQFLIDMYSAKYYIHYGTAGAIHPKLKIGDVVIANEIIEHDVKELFPEQAPPPCHTLRIPQVFTEELRENERIKTRFAIGRIASGDEDIVTKKRRNKLLKIHNVLSVDWESAGFALTCELNNVYGIVLRVISDYAYEATHDEYEQNKNEVIHNIIKIMLQYEFLP